MKPFTATVLAASLAVAMSSAIAADQKPDTAAYRSMTQQAGADYKAAAAKCTGMSGNERAVCVEEAKVARARIDADAVVQHNNTLRLRTAARTALANAEHALARVKCTVMSGAEKDSCLSNARSVRVAALADAKADRNVRVAGAAVDGKGMIASTTSTEPAKAAAVDKCAKMTNGQPAAGCLVDNQDRTVANAVANTRDAAGTAAQKTERAAERLGERTERATAKTGTVVADSVITTKVKADLFKEPELSAMAIHVETEKGVVMLSGFVDSKADADKAVRLAKSIEGVSQVKSAIKVK